MRPWCLVSSVSIKYPYTYRSSDDPTTIEVFAALRLRSSLRPVTTKSAFRAPHSVQRSSLILQLWMEDVTAWVAVDQVRPEMGRSTPEPRVISQASRYLRVIMKTRHSFISVAASRFRLRRRRSNERRP